MSKKIDYQNVINYKKIINSKNNSIIDLYLYVLYFEVADKLDHPIYISNWRRKILVQSFEKNR